MKKEKYHYNLKSLQYEKISSNWKQTTLKSLGFIGSTIITSFIFIFVLSFFFDSPTERLLKQEIETNKTQISYYDKEIDRLAQELEFLKERDENTYRVIYEADPIPNSIWEAGVGGNERKRFNKDFTTNQLMSSVNNKIEGLKRKMVWQSKSYDEIANLIQNKEDMLASIPAIQPVANKDLKRMASGFGYRIHPVYKVRKMHQGMDFTAATGTEIYATGNGVVEDANYSNGGYGNRVKINHGYGYKTLYAHMSAIAVKPGEEVIRGQVIGYVGNTGTSVGPHLHYEVIKNGEKINPSYFYFQDLNDEEFEEMLRMSENSGSSLD
ncbi:MAG: M23 family metallopeptidase [Chitinophagales bacterium]